MEYPRVLRAMAVTRVEMLRDSQGFGSDGYTWDQLSCGHTPEEHDCGETEFLQAFIQDPSLWYAASKILQLTYNND